MKPTKLCWSHAGNQLGNDVRISGLALPMPGTAEILIGGTILICAVTPSFGPTPLCL